MKCYRLENNDLYPHNEGEWVAREFAARLVETLKKVEWVEHSDNKDYCPVCGKWQRVWHDKSCELNKLLIESEGI